MAIRLTVTIGALTLRDREVERMEINQTLGDHHRLSISFQRDPSQSLQLTDFVSPKVSVSLTDDATQKTVQAFDGIGVACEEQHQPRGGSHFVLTALSTSEKFSRQQNVRRFSDAVIGDIVSKYAGVVLTSSGKPRKADYVQAGETDLAFLVRLADDHQAFMRPLGDGMEIRTGFDDKRHTLTFGRNLQALTSRVTPANPRVKGAFYEFGKKEEVLLRDRTRSATESGAAPLTDAVQRVSSSLNGGRDPNILESSARTTTIGEFRDLLLRESERASGVAVTVDGASTNIELLAGDTIEVLEGSVSKLSNAPGTLGITKLTHVYDGEYSNSFTATPWTTFSNTSQPAKRLINGLVTAEVTDNVDPEGLGRIRVRQLGTDPDDSQSQLFARLLTPFAGNGRGIAFVPEVGDEVALGFEEGDAERPFVIGSVWNGQDVSPGVTAKRIITKAGNQLSMDDAGVIEIFSPSGKTLMQLSNDVNGTPRITIHSDGDLFLEAAERIQLTCKNLVEIVGANASRQIKGNDQTSVGGTRTAEVQLADSTTAGSVTMIAGMSSFEIGMQSVTTQSVQINSVAKVMNVVMGAMVQLNPPGFLVPPASAGSFDPPESKDAIPAGRDNPKPTNRVKVTRDDGPQS